MRRDPIKFVCEIVSVATGGDSNAIESVEEFSTVKSPPPREKVNDILYDYGVPQAKVLKSDLRRAYSGRRPKYFAHGRRLVSKFRNRLSIPKPSEHPQKESTGALRHASEIVDNLLERLQSDEPQDPYKFHGHACPHEQKVFYNSPEWRDRAKAIRAMDHFNCRSCGRDDIELQVHHIQPIYSVHSRKFHRNFDVVRMRTLCKACHIDLHKGMLKRVDGFTSNHDLSKSELQQRRIQSRKEHNQARECLWCQRFNWEPANWVPDGAETTAATISNLPF